MRVGLVASEVFTGLRRNASMVISVILVTFVSLTFVGAAILMQAQIGTMRDFWADRAQVAVYMCTSVSQQDDVRRGSGDRAAGRRGRRPRSTVRRSPR